MPQWTGRRSRHGVPVFVYSVSKTRPEDLLATTRADPGLSSVFLPAEYSTRFVQPLCARMHDDRAMPCSIFIVDLTGVTVRHFWNLRAHLQRASTMATLHYPESVEKIFVSHPKCTMEVNMYLFSCRLFGVLCSIQIIVLVLTRYFLTLDPWCTLFLSHCLGIHKQVVRTQSNLENIGSFHIRHQGGLNSAYRC